MQFGYSEKGRTFAFIFGFHYICSKFGIIRKAKTIVLELQGVIEFM